MSYFLQLNNNKNSIFSFYISLNVFLNKKISKLKQKIKNTIYNLNVLFTSFKF